MMELSQREDGGNLSDSTAKIKKATLKIIFRNGGVKFYSINPFKKRDVKGLMKMGDAIVRREHEKQNKN